MDPPHAGGAIQARGMLSWVVAKDGDFGGMTLAYQSWLMGHVTLLVGKKPKLVHEVKRYRLDMVGLTSIYSMGSGINLLEKGWTLFHSGVSHGARSQISASVLFAPWLDPCVLGFYPADELTCFFE